jgi:hypothetical protein
LGKCTLKPEDTTSPLLERLLSTKMRIERKRNSYTVGNLNYYIYYEKLCMFLKKLKIGWVPVGLVCNPSYLGG